MKYGTKQFASYVDNTNPYTYGQNVDEIVEKLEINMSKIGKWFHHNSFKSNPGTIHALARVSKYMTLQKRTSL